MSDVTAPQRTEWEAYRDGLLMAAQVVHAEARWQFEQDTRGIVGAQIVALRMTEVEKAINGIASTISVPAVPEHLADVVSDLQMQRHLDNEPCPSCGGDRLRLDFVTPGRCHVPKEKP